MSGLNRIYFCFYQTISNILPSSGKIDFILKIINIKFKGTKSINLINWRLNLRQDRNFFLYCPYWKDRDLYLLKRAETFEEVKDVAVSVLQRMPNGLSQLCGPLSTGGDLKRNMEIFKRCIVELRAQNLNPFDQAPLEIGLTRLKNKWDIVHNNEYCMPILEVVYKAVFESGKIVRTYFLPNWETSFGSRWERAILYELGVEINEFPIQWYEDIVRELNPFTKVVA